MATTNLKKIFGVGPSKEVTEDLIKRSPKKKKTSIFAKKGK